MCSHDKRWAVYSQKDLGAALGIDPSTVGQWVRQGMQREKSGRNRWRYCIPCSVQWRLSQCDTPSQVVDAELLGGDSPALERFRLARAKISELELQKLELSLVPVDDIRSGLGRFATIIRQLAERLGQRYGPEATLSVNDALDDCQAVIDDAFHCA